MTELIAIIVCSIIVFLIFPLVIHQLLSLNVDSGTTCFPRNQRVLLITAHPDDECMFFAPTILSQLKLENEIFILCMSTGDYYKEGDVRKSELLKSCSFLGIPASHVEIVDDRELRDDPTATWDIRLVSRHINRVAQQYGINLLVTFDSGGVSGHLNHQALFHACRYLKSRDMVSNGADIFVLDSVSLVRKYIFLLDILPSYLLSSSLVVSSWSQLVCAWKAMASHKSQYVWFRKLYVVFSRYMVINTLTPITKTANYVKARNRHILKHPSESEGVS